MQTRHTCQEGARFLSSKSEISRTDLGQVTPRTQTGQGERRVGSCRYDQMEPGRQMVEEIRDGSMDRWHCDHMVIIQDERHLIGQGSKAIDPDGQDGFYGRKLLGS